MVLLSGRALDASFGHWDGPIQLAYHVDGLSLLFALMGAGLGSAVLLYSVGYMEKEKGTTRFIPSWCRASQGRAGHEYDSAFVALLVFPGLLYALPMRWFMLVMERKLRADAIAYGAVGPVARAPGVDTDQRRDHSYLAYAKIEFAVPRKRRAMCRPAWWCGRSRLSRAAGSSSRYWIACRRDRFTAGVIYSVPAGDAVVRIEAHVAKSSATSS